MPKSVPYSAIDIPEVMSRNQADAALTDARDLAAEVTRLSAELTAARLWHANALAAMRATIGAQRDGEPDPLYYIHDELSAPQNHSKAREGSKGD